jgi:hypothetical protein
MFNAHFSGLARLVSAQPPPSLSSHLPTSRVSQRIRPRVNLADHRAALTKDLDAYLAGIPRVCSPNSTPQVSNFPSGPSPSPPALQYQQRPQPAFQYQQPPQPILSSVPDQNIPFPPPSRVHSQPPNQINYQPPNLTELFNKLRNNRAELDASARSIRAVLFSPQSDFDADATLVFQSSFAECWKAVKMTPIVQRSAYVLAHVFKDRTDLDRALPIIHRLRPVLRPGFMLSSATLKERGYSELAAVSPQEKLFDASRIGLYFTWYFDFLCYERDRIREFVIPKIKHVLTTAPVLEIGAIAQGFLDTCGRRVAEAFPDDMKTIIDDMEGLLKRCEAEKCGTGDLRHLVSWISRIKGKIVKYHNDPLKALQETWVPSD